MIIGDLDNPLVIATRFNGKFTDLKNKDIIIQVFDDGQE